MHVQEWLGSTPSFSTLVELEALCKKEMKAKVYV